MKACAYSSYQLGHLNRHQLKHGARRKHPYGKVENPRAVKKAAGTNDRESDSENENDEADDTMAGVEHIQTADLSAAQDSSMHCNTKD